MILHIINRMCEFLEEDFSKYENKKLDFTVYLNTDYIYSLFLNHFAQNWPDLYKQTGFKLFSEEDIECVLKAMSSKRHA